MSTWRFDDWGSRQYDDPKVGLVHPGDTVEADTAPDNQHWTLVTPTVVTPVVVPVVEDVKEDVKEDEAPLQGAVTTEEDADSEVEKEEVN